MRNSRGVTGVELLVILAIATLFTTCIVSLNGCTGGPQIQNPQMANVAVELAGFNLGYWIGKDRPEADAPIREAYLVARTGQLPPETVAQAISELQVSDPLLAGNCMIMLKAMGAGFAPSGQLASISNIPPEVWDAAKTGYVQGFAVGKLKRG